MATESEGFWDTVEDEGSGDTHWVWVEWPGWNGDADSDSEDSDTDDSNPFFDY